MASSYDVDILEVFNFNITKKKKKKFSRRGKKRDKLTSFSFLDAILTFYFASLFVTREKSDDDVESWRRAARCRELWRRNVAPGKVECRLSLAPEERDAADTEMWRRERWNAGYRERRCRYRNVAPGNITPVIAGGALDLKHGECGAFLPMTESIFYKSKTISKAKIMKNKEQPIQHTPSQRICFKAPSVNHQMPNVNGTQKAPGI